MTIIANRYELQDKLGAGGMGEVYRVHDRLTNDIVALKRVLVAPNQMAFNTQHNTNDARLALAQEFKTLASLRHPHIISVLDYGFDEQRHPFFTMELLEEPRTLTQAAETISHVQRLELILQVLEALRYLHLRGLIHRDLKPANILVTTTNQIKVVDFGLSIFSKEGSGIAGTIGYIAPESFQKKPLTPHSDLFSIGVLIYQLMVGDMPFTIHSMADYFSELSKGSPDLSILSQIENDPNLRMRNARKDDINPTFMMDDDSDKTVQVELPKLRLAANPIVNSATPNQLPQGQLARLVDSLLKFDANERPASAEAVQKQLHQYLGIQTKAETSDIRESYLTTAPLVGRTAEVEQLNASIEQMLEHQAKWWLIGGESGVGKSRLVEEIRVHSLVKGIQVLHGQAVADGGMPFQMWRQLLRYLVLQVDVTSLEASILRDIIPDIELLLGRPVSQLSRPNDHSRQERIVWTISALFKRLNQPTLLILEDLQWTYESLLPLQLMSKLRDQLPTLAVIGTYRQEERPSLPQDLGEFELLRLKRLKRDDIIELSQAMLGATHENQTLIDLLESQTAGNTFFIVEVMRALANEAGRLSEVSNLDFPQEILTGGMQALLQRRLMQIPPSQQMILQYAAVIGRRIDGVLLQHLLPAEPLGKWLYLAESAAVMNIYEGKWQFTHDRLREAVLHNIPSQHRRHLHQQVALAIETCYAADSDYDVRLLEHWHQAQSLDKEFHYLMRVAENTMKIGTDYEFIRTLVQRCLDQLADEDVRQIPLLNILSEAHNRQGNYTQAQLFAESAYKLAVQVDDNQGIADSLASQGSIALNLGAYAQAADYFQQRLIIQQSLPDPYRIANCLYDLGLSSFRQGNYTETRDYHGRSMTIRTQLGDQHGIASNLSGLGDVATAQGDYEAAKDYYERALAIHTALGEQLGVGNILNNLGFLTYRQSQYEQSYDYFQRNLSIRQTIGDQKGIATSWLCLGMLASEQGDYQTAYDYFAQGLFIFRTIGEQRGIGVCLNNLGLLAYRQGDYTQAETYHEQCLVIFRTIGDQHSIGNSLSNLASDHLKLGKSDTQALYVEALEVALSIETIPLVLELLVGFAWIYIKQENITRAAELVGLVKHHPALNGDVRLLLSEIIPDLERRLTSTTIQTIMEKGAMLNLDTVVQDVLAVFGEITDAN